MANQLYNIARYKMGTSGFTFTTADVRVLLVGTGYTFNADHQFVSEVVGNEVTGGTYARQALEGKTATQNNTLDRAVFGCNNLAWLAISVGTIKAAIAFVQVTNDADSWLLGYIDSGGFPFVTGGGNFLIEFDPTNQFLQI
jgi:hypothetical protein